MSINLRIEGPEEELRFVIAQLRKAGLQFSFNERYYPNRGNDLKRAYLSDLNLYPKKDSPPDRRGASAPRAIEGKGKFLSGSNLEQNQSS